MPAASAAAAPGGESDGDLPPAAFTCARALADPAVRAALGVV